MSITSNAVSSELDSPFYKRNEALCKEWEQYIISRGGKIIGSYNAWSIAIKSKVTVKKTWLIDIQKATYSNGSLFFSSKYQNLQETLTFKSIFKNTGCGNFCISRSFFSRKKRNHAFYNEVQELLKNEIKDRSLYKAKFKNSELTIIIHGKNGAFNLVDRVLEFEYT
ncbi:MAG: hypothetical protein WED10_08865 [Brumimicrobium sp.]